MDATEKNCASPDQRSTDRIASISTEIPAPGPTDEIAISAIELIKLIESGQGNDVNELVNRVLNDRQAA